MSFTTPTNPRPLKRTPLRNRGRKVNTPFKSPMRISVEEKKEDSDQKLLEDIQMLKENETELDKEISALTEEGYKEEELSEHIEKLHTYNEIKDIGQMLLGRIAEIQGTTTRELYQQYDINLDD